MSSILQNQLRVALDALTTGSTKVPSGVLTLTLGKGEEVDGVHSPTSSSGSKRAKIGFEDASDDRSAASLEEDRRVQ